MAKQNHGNPVILRRPEVQRRTGLSRSTIYNNVVAGTFPAPVAIGPRAVGWLEHEVSDWIRRQVAASRGAA